MFTRRRSKTQHTFLLPHSSKIPRVYHTEIAGYVWTRHIALDPGFPVPYLRSSLRQWFAQLLWSVG